MKKIIYILLSLVFLLQVASAQGNRPVIVRFHNGNTLRGVISRLPNDNRLRLQAPNGRIVLFSPNEASSITYEDGSRVTSIPLAPQQGQQNRQGTQQGQQNRQGQSQQGQANQQNRQGQPNQQYRQGQSNQQNRQGQPNQQNRQGQPNQQNRQGTNQQNNRAQNSTNRNNAGNDDFFFEDEGSEMVLKPVDKKQANAAQRPVGKPEDAFSPHSKALIDVGYTLGMGDEFNKASRMEFTLSYGVQATEGLFIGIGSGLHLYSDTIYLAYTGATAATHVDTTFSKMIVPLFLDARYNFSTGGSIVPFIGMKAGYSLGIISTTSVFERPKDGATETVKRIEKGPKGFGLYLSPSVGAKYMLGRSFAINLSVGYTVQMKKYTTVRETIGYINNGSMGGVTVKAGLEF
jgi:hypothetical protein